MRYWLFLLPFIGVALLSSGASGREGYKMDTVILRSPAFEQNGYIPHEYTCDGKDINPPLTIDAIPRSAKSLSLIVDDPDAPGRTWVHWVLWNIDPTTTMIRENEVPAGAIQGRNDFKKTNYGGPCPPSGTHRYFFKVYALDIMLSLPSTSTKADLERAMTGHILAEGHLVGVYRRK